MTLLPHQVYHSSFRHQFILPFVLLFIYSFICFSIVLLKGSLRLGRKRGRFNAQSSPFSSFGGQRGKHGDGELKSVKEILQKREKVQFMKERRLKKRRQKGRSGGSGRSLGGRGKNGSGIRKTGGKGRAKRKAK